MNYKNSGDELVFFKLRFALSVLNLPVNNVYVERVFSTMNFSLFIIISATTRGGFCLSQDAPPSNSISHFFSSSKYERRSPFAGIPPSYLNLDFLLLLRPFQIYVYTKLAGSSSGFLRMCPIHLNLESFYILHDVYVLVSLLEFFIIFLSSFVVYTYGTKNFSQDFPFKSKKRLFFHSLWLSRPLTRM